jgi:hypothetical protein
MTPIADLVGPLAEGVILFGVVPAAVLVPGMIVISRLVAWRTSRAHGGTGPDAGHHLPES